VNDLEQHIKEKLQATEPAWIKDNGEMWSGYAIYWELLARVAAEAALEVLHPNTNM
jgi:hypothetical protein